LTWRGDGDGLAEYVGPSSGEGVELLFHYGVKIGDDCRLLDYVDALSLTGPDSAPPGVYHASTRTTMRADVRLPVPGTAGSLSRTGAAAAIDGARAHVVSVTSPRSGNTALTGESVTVLVEFSRPVAVSGTPRLLLDAGPADRAAHYAGGSGTAVLAFEYVVELGDASPNLDYRCVDGVGRSAAGSLWTDGVGGG